MKLTLNFSQSVYYNRVLVRSSMIFTVVILSSLLVFQLLNYYQTSKSTDLLSKEFALLTGSGDGDLVDLREYSQAQKSTLTQQAEHINQLIADVTFQWSPFLANLEGVVPQGVKVRSIAPKGREGSSQIVGVAKDLKSMRSFIDKLYSSPLFSDVELNQHESATIKDRQGKDHRVVSFSLALTGRSDAK